MKKNYLILLLVLFFATAICQPTNASVEMSSEMLQQIIKEKKVTINKKNATLDEILTTINKQSNVGYGYQDAAIDKNRRFSLVVTNVSIEAALNKLFEGSDYDYRLDNNRIVIVRKVSARASSNQSKTPIRVEGKILDENGHPIAGAVVVVEGTSKWIVTNDKGIFGINMNSGETLEISYTGYKPQKMVVEKSTDNAVFRMETDTVSIGDVVINGYQVTDKSKSASSVTTLKMEDIATAGINSIDKLLEGRVPGMTFMQNSGQVGAAPKIRIRGSSTILGSQEPLWVVDGIIQHDPVRVDPTRINDLDFVNLLGNAISGLNPDDVEQIDVLKDASATAIYGARAANGVIVITTKKGKEGPARVSYSFSGTFTQRPRYTDENIYQMNSKERIDVSRELLDKSAAFPSNFTLIGYEKAVSDFNMGRIDGDEFQRLSNYYETVNTDWFGLLTRNSFSHKHTVNISGGSSLFRYYASVGYNNEDGATRSENLNGINASLKLNGNLKRFKYQFGISVNSSNRHYTPSTGGASIIQYAYETSRAIPAYNPDGSNFFYDKSNGAVRYPFNVMNDIDKTGQNINNFAYQVNGTIGYNILKGFDAEVVGSYSRNSNKNETVYEEGSYYISTLRKGGPTDLTSLCPFGGEYRLTNSFNSSYTARAQLRFNRLFGDKHEVSALLGGELSSTAYNSLATSQRGYYPGRGKTFATILPGDGYVNYTNYLINNTPTISESLTNMISAYFSATYSYDNRYFINFNTRTDASNQFGSRSREKILPIWSISGRWNMKQDLFKRVGFVNEMALKLSFGYQGNMLNNQATRMIINKESMDTEFLEYKSTVNKYPNPNLRWEKTASYNAEWSFMVWQNKLNVVVSYFYKHTKDAFLSKRISSVNGIMDYVVNSGELVNQGVEVNLQFEPFKQKVDIHGRNGFVWRFDPQIGQVVNNLVNKAINNKTNQIRDEIRYTDYLSGSIVLSGKPLNTFYSYRYKGLDPQKGYPTFYGMEEEYKDSLYTRYKAMPEAEVWMELMEESGTRVPVIQGGISNYFAYRQFSLSFNLTYSFGNKMRLLNLCGQNAANMIPLPQTNMRREFVDRWRSAGDEAFTNIPGLLPDGTIPAQWWTLPAYSDSGNMQTRYTNDDIYSRYDNSNLRVVSGDYVKLQSLSLRYTLHKKVCDRLKISGASVSITGTNLFTIASPDLVGQTVTQSGSAAMMSIPVCPTYSASLNISF